MIQWWDETTWAGVMSVCTTLLRCKISKAPDSSECHCPAKSSIFTPLASARTTNSSPGLDINDRLIPSTMFWQRTETTRRSWWKVLFALVIFFAFCPSSRSAIFCANKDELLWWGQDDAVGAFANSAHSGAAKHGGGYVYRTTTDCCYTCLHWHCNGNMIAISNQPFRVDNCT